MGRKPRRERNGGGGIRTHKPVRAPHFECGALPFCHPSGSVSGRRWAVCGNYRYRLPSTAAPEADGVGFEPTRRFRRPHALQACAFNRSATRPNNSALGSGRGSPRRHPTPHRSVGPPGFEPGVSWSRAKRVANYTTGHYKDLRPSLNCYCVCFCARYKREPFQNPS